MAIARHFRSKGMKVAIGGFHVSGCISMLKELTPELKEAVDLGIVLFAGEAEEHFEPLPEGCSWRQGEADLQPHECAAEPAGQTIPYLPAIWCSATMVCCPPSTPGGVARSNAPSAPSSTSRAENRAGATPMTSSGSSWRTPKQGISRFFVTDDNFARNRNWEAIFDRMIELREEQGYSLHFLIQVDVLAHKIPNFIEKAARAGCRYVFIGLESINPENLVHMKKNQNRITEYRKMFQAWKEAGIVTYAGFIMGLPGDTPETIQRDIEIVQEELPVDLLEFTMLTPLPGSEDHQKLHEKGVWMDPDLNKYDLETVTVKHPRMSPEEWQRTYSDMWNWYYTDEHVERMMRRNIAYGIKPVRIVRSVLQIYGAPHFEGVHPQQCGYFRRKDRRERRPELPRVPALVFHPATPGRRWSNTCVSAPTG